MFDEKQDIYIVSEYLPTKQLVITKEKKMSRKASQTLP